MIKYILFSLLKKEKKSQHRAYSPRKDTERSEESPACTANEERVDQNYALSFMECI